MLPIRGHSYQPRQLDQLPDDFARIGLGVCYRGLLSKTKKMGKRTKYKHSILTDHCVCQKSSCFQKKRNTKTQRLKQNLSLDVSHRGQIYFQETRLSMDIQMYHELSSFLLCCWSDVHSTHHNLNFAEDISPHNL